MPNFLTEYPETCHKNWWINFLYIQNFVDYQNQVKWFSFLALSIFSFRFVKKFCQKKLFVSVVFALTHLFIWERRRAKKKPFYWHCTINISVLFSVLVFGNRFSAVCFCSIISYSFSKRSMVWFIYRHYCVRLFNGSQYDNCICQILSSVRLPVWKNRSTA